MEKWIQTPKPCMHCEVIDYCIASHESCEDMGVIKLKMKTSKRVHAYVYFPLLTMKKRRF